MVARIRDGADVNGRWALFIDAGWLFAAGSTLAFGELIHRRDLQWEPASVMDALRQAANQLVPPSAELLRTYWYDGSPNRLPIGQQNEIALLPDVKLRLGRTARDGQKGVDGLIIHDLITLAFRRDIADAVVVSGDEDLLDAIESAQANGTRVHLLEVPIGGIAPALLRCFDRVGTLGLDFFSMQLERTPEPQEVDIASDPLIAVETVPAPGGRFVPRPKWLDATHDASDQAIEAESGNLGDVAARAEGFAREWLRGATDDQYNQLLASRPYLAGGLDGQLLRSMGRWLTEDERRAARDSFWSTVASFLPGEPDQPR